MKNIVEKWEIQIIDGDQKMTSHYGRSTTKTKTKKKKVLFQFSFRIIYFMVTSYFWEIFTMSCSCLSHTIWVYVRNSFTQFTLNDSIAMFNQFIGIKLFCNVSLLWGKKFSLLTNLLWLVKLRFRGKCIRGTSVRRKYVLPPI